MKDVKEITYGCWDAIHIVTCSVTSASSAHYNVISTVMISLDAETPALGKMGIHGSCAKSQQADVQFSEDFKKNPDSFHLRNIGKLIETNEERLRLDVTEVYSAKQRQITNTGRLLDDYMNKDEKAKFQAELMAATSKLKQTVL